MAETNPTGASRLAPLKLTDEHVAILRRDLGGWIAALRAELEEPGRLRDPDATRDELAAYRRLYAGLENGAILVPDEVAARVIREAAEAHDAENGYWRSSPPTTRCMGCSAS